MQENPSQETHNLTAIASVFGVFVIIGALILFMRGNTTEITSDPVAQPANEVQEERELNTVGKMPESEEQPTAKGPQLPSNSEEQPGAEIKDNYINYSESALEQVLEDGGQALLFFHANWCPTCRSADKSLQTDGDQLPEDLVVLKTDYDTELDLKRKYNIVQQHTYVLLNAKGEVVTKWVGGGVETILENI